MARPWMALYVGDYLADTGHLTTEQHGAYLLLIMHYWRRGGLPDDDEQLAAITRTTVERWLNIRSTMFALFSNGWKHKRIDAELADVEKRSNGAKKAGIASAAARKANGRSTTVEQPFNGSPTEGQPSQPQPQYSVSKDTGADAPPDLKADLFRRAKQVLGREAGGLVAKLIRANGGEDERDAIPKSRAAIEMAAARTGGDQARAREYIGRVLKPKTAADFKLMSGIEGIL